MLKFTATERGIKCSLDTDVAPIIGWFKKQFDNDVYSFESDGCYMYSEELIALAKKLDELNA